MATVVIMALSLAAGFGLAPSPIACRAMEGTASCVSGTGDNALAMTGPSWGWHGRGTRSPGQQTRLPRGPPCRQPRPVHRPPARHGSSSGGLIDERG